MNCIQMKNIEVIETLNAMKEVVCGKKKSLKYMTKTKRRKRSSGGNPQSPDFFLNYKQIMKDNEAGGRISFLKRTLTNRDERYSEIMKLTDERYRKCRERFKCAIIDELKYIKDNFSGYRLIRGLSLLIDFLKEEIKLMQHYKELKQKGGNDTITKTWFLEYTRKKNLQILLQNICSSALIYNIKSINEKKPSGIKYFLKMNISVYTNILNIIIILSNSITKQIVETPYEPKLHDIIRDLIDKTIKKIDLSNKSRIEVNNLDYELRKKQELYRQHYNSTIKNPIRHTHDNVF